MEAWRLARIESPPSGFSPSSIFLNLHYLVAGTKNRACLRVIPIISLGSFGISGRGGTLIFEKSRLSASSLVSKALEEAEIWTKVNSGDHSRVEAQVQPIISQNAWISLPWVSSNVISEWLGSVRDLLREPAGLQEIVVGALFIIVVELSVPLLSNESLT